MRIGRFEYITSVILAMLIAISALSSSGVAVADYQPPDNGGPSSSQGSGTR